MKFTADQQDIIMAIGGEKEARRYQLALLSCVYALPPMLTTREEAEKRLRKKAKGIFVEMCQEDARDKYGFVSIVVLAILMVAVDAVIGWAITKLLDWLFSQGRPSDTQRSLVAAVRRRLW